LSRVCKRDGIFIISDAADEFAQRWGPAVLFVLSEIEDWGQLRVKLGGGYTVWEGGFNFVRRCIKHFQMKLRH
jgi:hypothetical protein